MLNLTSNIAKCTCLTQERRSAPTGRICLHPHVSSCRESGRRVDGDGIDVGERVLTHVVYVVERRRFASWICFYGSFLDQRIDVIERTTRARAGRLPQDRMEKAEAHTHTHTHTCKKPHRIYVQKGILDMQLA